MPNPCPRPPTSRTKALPLPDVIYERYSPGQNATFYIRAVPSRRSYPNGIRQFDKLVLLGIYDWKAGENSEWAFSWIDQEALARAVCEVMVKPEERRKFLDKFLEKLRGDFIQRGTIHQAFVEVKR